MSGLFGLPHSPSEAGVVIIPAPWDATTSYRAGAARGPAAIRAASHQIDFHDVEVGRPDQAGIAMLDIPTEFLRKNAEARRLAVPIIEAGGVGPNHPEAARVDALTEELHHWIRAQAEHWLGEGKQVGLVGGDHSVPESFIRLMAERHPGVGILHIDAHADLREAYEGFRHSHASIMFNVMESNPGISQLVQVGVRDLCEEEANYIARASGRITTHYDADLSAAQFRGETWAQQCSRIVSDLPSTVYVSFDIDGLDPALCPNTGTPVPGGLGFSQASYLIGELARTGRTIVGFDLSEVATGPNDDWDANVGMRVLYKLIGWMRGGIRKV